MIIVTVISPRISELVYLNIKEKDRKEKKKNILNISYSMINAYLKANIGVQLALSISCYRRESESGDRFGRGCEPAEQRCVSSGRIHGMVLIHPSGAGRYSGECSPLPPESILQELQREGFYIYWGKMVFPRFTYATYLIKYIYLFRLNSRMLWALLFPHP